MGFHGRVSQKSGENTNHGERCDPGPAKDLGAQGTTESPLIFCAVAKFLAGRGSVTQNQLIGIDAAAIRD